MKIRRVPVRPFDDQRPGTSGLRKRTRVFEQPHYLETFLEAVFRDAPGIRGGTLVVGGDGRYGNVSAIQRAIRMAAAHGVARVLVGAGGLLSTPATSAVIRQEGADGGLIFSASHNAGGPDGDFGVKFNERSGGPARTELTERFARTSRGLDAYEIAEAPDVDLRAGATRRLGSLEVRVIDPIEVYGARMRELVDFERLRGLAASGFRIVFDAMHAVTGPYARRLLVDEIGFPADAVLRAEPLEDFGGLHPDPNLIHARELVARMNAADAPDFGAACDGDGDRAMILGPGVFVTPSDSLAVLTANARLLPGYAGGLAGVARSLPTSRAVDRVARALSIDCYETPTGWKYFGNLLDAGRITLCGEESFGAGSDHIREKDGLWAVLCWLDLLAARRQGVAEVMAEHWSRFGRDYYCRGDYEGLRDEQAQAMMAAVRDAFDGLAGRRLAGHEVTRAFSFAYTDPVDGSVASDQGLVVEMGDEARLVFRLSGTGAEGAVLREYVERFEPAPAAPGGEAHLLLRELLQAGASLAEVESISGKKEPDVLT